MASYSQTTMATMAWNGAATSQADFVRPTTATVAWDGAARAAILAAPLIEYYIGSEAGALYHYDPSYQADAGESISCHYRTKTLDFTDMYPEWLGHFVTVYGAKLTYVDHSANTLFTLYISTDGGTTWSSYSNIVGTGDGATKTTTFWLIKTGQHFEFKIESSSSTTKFQMVALEFFLEPQGEHWET